MDNIGMHVCVYVRVDCKQMRLQTMNYSLSDSSDHT